jgi:hypothetical protein
MAIPLFHPLIDRETGNTIPENCSNRALPTTSSAPPPSITAPRRLTASAASFRPELSPSMPSHQLRIESRGLSAECMLFLLGRGGNVLLAGPRNEILVSEEG